MTHNRRYTDPFWDALSDGQFLLGRCEGCERHYFPPAPACPFCASQSVAWDDSTGQGSIYSYTREHRTPPGFEAPIVLGFVTLDEGPRVLGKIDAAYEDLHIGQSVRVEPYEYDGPFERDDLSDEPFFRFSLER